MSHNKSWQSSSVTCEWPSFQTVQRDDEASGDVGGWGDRGRPHRRHASRPPPQDLQPHPHGRVWEDEARVSRYHSCYCPSVVPPVVGVVLLFQGYVVSINDILFHQLCHLCPYVTCSNQMSRMSANLISRTHCMNMQWWFLTILTFCHQSILWYLFCQLAMLISCLYYHLVHFITFLETIL